MGTKLKLKLLGILALVVIAFGIFYLSSASIPVLQPSGPIAEKERNLIYIAVGLSLIVVVPVYVMLFSFAWKYRESNKKAVYKPSFDHSRLLESVWWGVPLIIILILGIITWNSSRDLDPFRPISSHGPSMKVQVVSLQWKWLFIYPQQGIATVNYLQIPLNTPLDFEITSDAPMNSFWIPQLGGQIYAMSGMSTHLNLMATKTGTYYGSSANISGDGFAQMHFNTVASSEADFNSWVNNVKYAAANYLDSAAYKSLAQPSQNSPMIYYGAVANGIYNSVLAKYEAPTYFTPTTENL